MVVYKNNITTREYHMSYKRHGKNLKIDFLSFASIKELMIHKNMVKKMDIVFNTTERYLRTKKNKRRTCLKKTEKTRKS